MASIRLYDTVKLADYGEPYIVAELNTSHFGNLDIARKMIDKAKEAACNCVKFQSWSEDTLYSKNYYDKNPIAKRFIKKFSFSSSDLKELSNYAKEKGIDFASTPYCTKEVDFLVNECKVPYIKVASMDLNNLAFLKYIANKGLPVVLSTGMGEMSEIKKAVKTIEETGNKNICILHCVSLYPTETSDIRLNNIVGLRKEFPDYPIGFSDHTMGIEVALAAISLGACMIEKHFTLDKEKIGMDNQMAIDDKELVHLVEGVHKVYNALGGEERVLSPTEAAQREVMRRSIVVSNSLRKGHILRIEDLDVKRPGNGISPEKIEQLIGKKLTRDLEKNEILHDTDIV